MSEGNEHIVKNYPPRVSHAKGDLLPSRGVISQSSIEIDAPLVSIILLAYNKVAFTKQCIESIYKYSDNVDYELIVIDNGSTDGETLAYFESLPKRRIVQLKHNQGPIGGFNEGAKVARGKYIAAVCNDFIFTTNWLSNLVTCIESDEKIGYVAPGASSISNYQQITLAYDDLEQMQVKAAQYNQSDPSKWEERIRLMPTVWFVRKEVFDIVGYYDPFFYYGEFGDDDFSFRVRRAGYKIVYCGDTFTYHFGSVTVAVDQNEKDSLAVSRELFQKKFNGIDAWRDVKHDFNLLGIMSIRESSETHIRILAIEPRCGNTLIWMKNKLRKQGICNVELVAYVENPMYYEDLRTICGEVYVGKLEDIDRWVEKDAFDYVIFDESLNLFENPKIVLGKGLRCVKSSGQVLCSLLNPQYIGEVLAVMNGNINGVQGRKSSLSLDDIRAVVAQQQCKVEFMMYEKKRRTEKEDAAVKLLVENLCTTDQQLHMGEQLNTGRYLMRITPLNN